MIEIKNVKTKDYYIKVNKKEYIATIKKFDNNDFVECWLTRKDYGISFLSAGILCTNFDEDCQKLLDNLYIQDYFTLIEQEIEEIENR